MNRIRYVRWKDQWHSKRIFGVGNHRYRAFLSKTSQGTYAYSVTDLAAKVIYTNTEEFDTLRAAQDAVKKTLEGFGVSFEKEERDDKGTP